MRTYAGLLQRLDSYQDALWIYDPNVGHLSWHVTTGDNIEMLFIEVIEKGKGHGRELYQRFAERLIDEGKEPYHSLIAYRLKSNEEAGQFYRKMGWTEVYLGQSIYKGESTVLLWITWKKLLENIGINQRSER